MSNRIEKEFLQLREGKCGGFIPFIVAGDPNLETSGKLILELARIGANVIELGVPFSDPVADGFTIQKSTERALRNRVNIQNILDLISDVRKRGCETPIILFSYFNPLLQFGLEKFAADAERIGLDGVLVTDLVPEEAEGFREILTDKNQSLITLAAPTSSDERLKKITDIADGFVYAVSRAGVTGARTDLTSDAEILVKRLQKFTDLPVAVGFGISSKEQVREVWKYADAAVIGSAIVAEVMKLAPDIDEVPTNFIEKIGEFTQTLLPNN
ncbi:MAG: tryptophan synthase subunit alpha [Pyrinomonadaceae bacterium]